MLRNLLTSVILWVYDTYKNFVSIPNHKIECVTMEYVTGTDKIYSADGPFWKNEMIKWNEFFNEHYAEFNDLNYTAEETPSNVKKAIIRIKYWYNDKLYKYLTYNTKHEWPPTQENHVVFNMPLVSAYLMDADDKPVKDILGKIRRYAGPRGDFHREEVKISDMLYYDVDTLRTMYPTIKLKNVLGKVKSVSTVDDYVTDLFVL